MSRWESGSGVRLEQAAVELFTEQGFAETTVPQIAARAGLTTRTFFRHFADKREVLFAGQADIPDFVAKMIADAPADSNPMQIIAGDIERVAGALFGDDPDYFRVRRAIIQSDAGLRERELRKLATIQDAMRSGLERRGTDALTATLVAEVALSVFRTAITIWVEGGGTTPLPALVRSTLDRTRAIMADPGWDAG